jgi:hypothetical protein
MALSTLTKFKRAMWKAGYTHFKVEPWGEDQEVVCDEDVLGWDELPALWAVIEEFEHKGHMEGDCGNGQSQYVRGAYWLPVGEYRKDD